MPPSERPGEQAGQVENLVDRLRGLTRDYPFGIGLIKELLQNADDGGASAVTFTLDQRTLPADELPDPRMSALLGPALVVTSDQVFRPEDLAAIQRIQQGHKREDATSTGRFGLGFNAVYNVTDFPSFATGGEVMTFDPHRDVVAHPGELPGRRWTLPDLWADGPGWPRALGIDENAHQIAHTVLRLPLRTQPVHSEALRISHRAVQPADVEEVFRQVESWGGSMLLFLRSVLHLNLEVINAQGDRAWAVQIHTANIDLVTEARAKAGAVLTGATVQEVWDTAAADPASLVSTLAVHEVELRGDVGRTERWLVVQGATPLADSPVFAAANQLLSIEEKPLPIVGAACQLPTQHGAALPDTKGHLFCTLPLPEPTGLPFHVNAFVDLDSARRGPTMAADLVGNAALRYGWNIALLHELAVPAVVQLIAEVARRAHDGSVAAGSAYSVMPIPGQATADWVADVAQAILRASANRPIFLHRGGNQLSLHPRDTSQRPPPVVSDALCDRLMDDGLELLDPPVPAPVLESLAAAESAPTELTPAGLREWLQTIDGDQWDSLEDAPWSSLHETPHIKMLLKFCSEGKEASLLNLPLGLLRSGELIRFGTGMVRFYADKQHRELFPTRPHWFWSSEVEEHVAPIQIKGLQMGVGLVVVNLTTYLEAHPVAWNPQATEPPNSAWLGQLCRYLASQPLKPAQVEALRKLAFVPHSDDQLVPRSQVPGVFLDVDDPTAVALSELGCRLPPKEYKLHKAFRKLAEEHTELAEVWAPAPAIRVLAECTGERLASLSTEAINAVLTTIEQALQCTTPGIDVSALREKHLWRTIDNVRVAASHRGLHRPAGFKPPEKPSVAILLSAETNSNFGNILDALWVPKLTRLQFIRAIALRFAASGEEAGHARKWAIGEGKWQPDEITELKQCIRVPDTQDTLRTVQELFDPDQAATAKAFEGAIHLPNKAHRSKAWCIFLRELGLPNKVEGRHTQALADHWGNNPPTIAQAKALCEWLCTRPLTPDDNLSAICRPLQHLRWLPTQRWPALAAKAAPETTLASPTSCVRHSWRRIAGAQHPVSPEQLSNELCEALNIPDRPDPEWVHAQLRVPVEGPLSSGALHSYQEDLLEWLRTEDRPDLGPFQSTPWLAGKNRQWLPRDAYFADVKWASGHMHQVKAKKPHFSMLQRLGVDDKPNAADIQQLLHQLPQRQQLKEGNVNLVCRAYAELEKLQPLAKPDMLTQGRWLALSRTQKLLPAPDLLFDDAPWFSAGITEGKVDWLASDQLNPVLCLTLGVRRASLAVTSQRSGGTPTTATDPTLQQLRSRLSAAAFTRAVLRIVAAIDKDRDGRRYALAQRSLSERRLEVDAWDNLQITLTVDDNTVGNTSARWVLQGRQLTLATPSRLWHAATGSALAQLLNIPELYNDNPLVETLKADPDEDLEALLDELRVPRDPHSGDVAPAPPPDPDVEPAMDELEDGGPAADDPGREAKNRGRPRSPASPPPAPTGHKDVGVQVSAGGGEVDVRGHTRSLPISPGSSRGARSGNRSSAGPPLNQAPNPGPPPNPSGGKIRVREHDRREPRGPVPRDHTFIVRIGEGQDGTRRKRAIEAVQLAWKQAGPQAIALQGRTPAEPDLVLHGGIVQRKAIVCGLKGSWKDGPAILTRRDMALLAEWGAQGWLYVVETARGAQPRIRAFRDPLGLNCTSRIDKRTEDRGTQRRGIRVPPHRSKAR